MRSPGASKTPGCSASIEACTPSAARRQRRSSRRRPPSSRAASGGARPRSAMVLWGMWKRWEEPFDVSIAGDRRPPGITVHRVSACSGVTSGSVTDSRPTAARVARLRARMAPKSLTRRINDARRAGILTVEAIADVVERFPFHAARRCCAPRANNPDPTPLGPSRKIVLPFCRALRPTPAAGEHRVARLRGRTRLPFREMVIVELDGGPSTSDARSIEADPRRDATMLERGIPSCGSATAAPARPEREAARLESILASREGAEPRRLPRHADRGQRHARRRRRLRSRRGDGAAAAMRPAPDVVIADLNADRGESARRRARRRTQLRC